MKGGQFCFLVLHYLNARRCLRRESAHDCLWCREPQRALSLIFRSRFLAQLCREPHVHNHRSHWDPREGKEGQRRTGHTRSWLDWQAHQLSPVRGGRAFNRIKPVYLVF